MMGRLIQAGYTLTKAPIAHMVAALVLCNAVLFSAMTAYAADDGSPIRIVAFGDSLTAGFQLQPNEAFPVQLQAALKAKGHNLEIANAGVSGDTASSGLERFDWAVPEGTEGVILELGANDALRGVPPAETKKNLTAILEKLKARNIVVLLAGMRALSNWGDDYQKSFDAIYPDLAKDYDAVLYPFFLEGVVRDPKLNLNDGLHPTAAGIGKIVQGITPSAEALIARVKAKRAQN